MSRTNGKLTIIEYRGGAPWLVDHTLAEVEVTTAELETVHNRFLDEAEDAALARCLEARAGCKIQLFPDWNWAEFHTFANGTEASYVIPVAEGCIAIAWNRRDAMSGIRQAESVFQKDLPNILKRGA